MLRDGLTDVTARKDCFTANDINAVIDYNVQNRSLYAS